MADLRLTVSGEDRASGAVDSAKNSVDELGRASEDMGKTSAHHVALAVEAYNLLGEALKKGLELVVEFGKESVEAFSKQEQATRQLKLAVGEFSGALTEQADAFEKSFGVSSEMVQKMDAMLYRFGVAPADIEKTTQALLDYSAATGEDALSATRQLLVAAESGRQAFKELGLQYDESGTKAEKVGSIVDALAGKIGGAAGADANTLAGRTRILSAHWEDLQKAFGGFIADVESKLGVLSALTNSLQHAGDAWQIVRGFVQHGDMPGTTMERINAGAMMDQGNAAAEAFRLSQARGNPNNGQTAAASKAIASGAGSVGAKGQATKETVDENVAAMQRMAEDDEKLTQQNWMNKANAAQKALQKQADAEEHHQQWKAAMLEKYAQKGVEIAERAAAKEAAIWASAAAQASASIQHTLGNVLRKLVKGEKVEAGDVLGQLLGAAGRIGGNFFGVGDLGGDIGDIAGHAIGDAMGGGSSMGRMHGGGWVGAPRYHTGTWVGADEHPAILQSGERVLSRREVASMGGPSGVDGASRGGGSVNVTVQTMDGSSTKEFFERAGGRALLNAIRTGRGSPALLFGGT